MSIRDKYVGDDEEKGRILNEHYAGNPPSDIDSKLMLMGGTAHDVIVAWWAFDKERKKNNNF